MENLHWVADKIKQHLDNGPFILEFGEYNYFDMPVFVYKSFVILINNENSITVGIQPTMDNERRELLINSLKMIVDEVIERELYEKNRSCV